MNNPLRTPDEYELFVYTLADDYPEILRSTLTFIRIGMTLARVSGEITFEKGYRLVVRERLVYTRWPVVIDGYGYEIWQGDEKVSWYDSQPHPQEPTLRSTAPHHQHIPPDIKHHRIPAPAMSFTAPNVPFLIQEIIARIHRTPPL